MATSLPLQASRLPLPHAPGPLHTIDIALVVAVIIPYSAILFKWGHRMPQHYTCAESALCIP